MRPDTLLKVLATFREGDRFLGSIYFAKFNLTVSLSLDKERNNEDYDHRCIEAFFNWGETLFIKLQDTTFEYYKDYEEMCGGFDDLAIDSPSEIWQYCKPTNIHFTSSSQDSSSTFIDVELDCDWEIEHGMQWLVKNTDELMYVGPYFGNASTDEINGMSNYV